MKKIIFIASGLLISVIIVLSLYLLLSNNTLNSSKGNNSLSKEPTKEVKEIIKNTKTVLLTNTGFVPKTLEITAGTRVLWTNTSEVNGSVNSDPYPTNSLWKFLNLGLFKNGDNMTLIFDKPGKYTYHNQLKPDQTGTIIVK